jgi:hypothetical protein
MSVSESDGALYHYRSLNENSPNYVFKEPDCHAVAYKKGKEGGDNHDGCTVVIRKAPVPWWRWSWSPREFGMGNVLQWEIHVRIQHLLQR